MVTTQILDTHRGKPAARVPVELDFFVDGHGWRQVGQALTDHKGGISDFGESPIAGIYRLAFDIAAYDIDCMFPSIAITFEVRDPTLGCHLPLVLSQFGYTTFRGN
jgi:5-hydroxyisourate hydrolase